MVRKARNSILLGAQLKLMNQMFHSYKILMFNIYKITISKDDTKQKKQNINRCNSAQKLLYIPTLNFSTAIKYQNRNIAYA